MGDKIKRPCPACESRGGGGLHRIKMLLPKSFGLDGEYDIVSCDKCGCCYADVLATEADYDNYYRNHNIYGGWQANSTGKPDIDVVIRSISQLVHKNAKIIDVGFGNGRLLGELKKAGFTDIMGIDPSTRSVSELEKAGIPGKVGSIYDGASSDEDKADVVIFTMVLEHLLMPGKAVEAIRDNLLKENGYVVVSWPYFDDLIADGSPIMNNFNHEHINYFSKQTADVLFHRFGFESKAHHISLGVCRDKAVQFSNVAVYCRTSKQYDYKISKDEKTRESILEYIGRVSQDEMGLLRAISEIAASGKKVAVWGVGSYLYHLLMVSDLTKCDIAFLIDKNPAKQGEVVFGYEVKSPNDLYNFEGAVIVAVMLYGKEIREEIESMGNGGLEVVEGKMIVS